MPGVTAILIATDEPAGMASSPRGQFRIVYGHPAHGNADTVLVVAKTVHGRLKTRNVCLRPCDQGEGLQRAGRLQSGEL